MLRKKIGRPDNTGVAAIFQSFLLLENELMLSCLGTHSDSRFVGVFPFTLTIFDGAEIQKPLPTTRSVGGGTGN